jgi:hypothetical protein
MWNAMAGALGDLATPKALEFRCRERTAQDHIKKAPISLAKRSAGTPCSAAVGSSAIYAAIFCFSTL